MSKDKLSITNQLATISMPDVNVGLTNMLHPYNLVASVTTGIAAPVIECRKNSLIVEDRINNRKHRTLDRAAFSSAFMQMGHVNGEITTEQFAKYCDTFLKIE